MEAKRVLPVVGQRVRGGHPNVIGVIVEIFGYWCTVKPDGGGHYKCMMIYELEGLTESGFEALDIDPNTKHHWLVTSACHGKK
jgi:hypothetical protein